MGDISYINYHVLLVSQKSIGGENNFDCTEMSWMIFLQVYEMNLIICIAKVGSSPIWWYFCECCHK